MIGSFWNLCRATCPAMPVDKQLHSEYRSTYRWHEYTGPRQEVVRKPPIQNGMPAGIGGVNEPIEKPIREEDFQSDTAPKQEPVMPRRKKYPDLAYRHHEFLISDRGVTTNGGVDSRARSEERFGPDWRPSRRSKSEGPRRGIETEPERRRESDPDMENMVKDKGHENGLLRKAISKISTEYRRQFAWPPGHVSRRDELDGTPRKSQSMGALKANANALIHKKRMDVENKDASELEPLVDDRSNKEKIREELNNFSTDLDNDSSWYREVVELRKKAGEYKHRGWGSELAPERLSDIYNKQVELWDQVSRRSSLSALSLASHMTKNTYTKEDKDEDNNRKSSPTKAYRNAENNARMIRDIIRHHLERTTGGSELDGLILSPTREKLEPTVPRRDDDSRGSQKNSPKKGSPLKTSSKRGSQKGKEVRSHSVGPTETSNKEKQSPKRQSRSTVKEGRKSASNTPSNKRPRPSSLNTTVSFRSKSSSVVKNHDDRLAKTNKNKSLDSSKRNRKGSHEASEQAKSDPIAIEMKKSVENEQPDSIEYEPVIKSPPEPTRVKSPEQIIMRSPDPVNWTVPLDTGKTFTVTQNVRDGDPSSRPQSEVKAWTPPEVPPPVAQSAPPTLAQGQATLS
ncbi:micronuclear linker histone polyprotein isoform X2 [Euwallacea fornicatus]|uniref:micronuclear linker histone polyprotein isoform X2 n=1 Tax=Euwallacea fornicatus TaxID=995702 RepID=UPI00339020B0